MGLLTDPAGLHGRPFQTLVANQGRICLLLYVISVVWYCLLAHDQVNSATYLSENALLPGLVTVGCDTSDLGSLLKELEKERETHQDSLPTAWIKAKLARAGIEVYDHNFTLHYPLGRKGVFKGRNVYGIIRGGGAGTESVVLSVPYRAPGSAHPATHPGLALMLSVAASFRKERYWAKDIILLVTEHEQLGVQAWLEAYHGARCGLEGVLDSGDLEGRGGSIQAAVNLEIPSGRLGSVEVKLLGLNGQLPNLDLANLVHRIGTKERVPHSFAHGRVGRGSFNSPWVDSLFTMTWMVVNQASGVPDGNHGLFHRFGIEAVTLEGHADHPPVNVSLDHVARVIEGIFRSINNLLERFHQSYFFYLLVNTDRFVSIGLYMPCVGLLVGAMFIKAFALYLGLRGLLQSAAPNESSSSSQERSDSPNLNSIGVGIVFLSCYSVGFLVANSGQSLTQVVPQSRTEDSLFLGYAALSLVTALLPPLILKRYCSESDWVCLHIASLVHLATMIIAVAMHNFSLAFIVGLAVAPSTLIVKSSRNGFLRKLLILAIHPLSLLFLSVATAASIQFPPSEFLYRTWMGTKQALVLGLVDSLVYSSWSHTVATLFYLPNWCMFWVVAHSETSCLEAPGKMEEQKPVEKKTN